MDMKKINSGRLRAIGYDASNRMLQVQLDDGSTLQYSGVGEDAWRRFSSSSAAWSFYRDNIEEEFTAKRVSGKAPAGNNPLDELFGEPSQRARLPAHSGRAIMARHLAAIRWHASPD